MQLTIPVPAQDSQACTAQHAGRQPGLSGSWATAACLPTACVARQMCHLLTLHSKLVTQASNPGSLAPSACMPLAQAQLHGTAS